MPALKIQDAPTNRRSAAPISARAAAADRIMSTAGTDVWIWPRQGEVASVDTGGRQGLGVRRSLVAQRVELAGHDERRRQVGQIVGAQRRRLRVLPIRRIGVVIPEPAHQRRGEHVAVAVGDVRLAREVAVGHRGHQHLTGDAWTAGIARHLADDGGDVAAGAPAADRELGPAHRPAPRRWPRSSARRRTPSSTAAGNASLGRVAVVDRHDDGVRAHAEVAAERVVGVVAAEHPAAAVEVDDDRVRTRARGPVEAVRQRAGRAGQLAVDDLAHLGTGRSLGCHGHRDRARLLDRQRLERGQPELLDELEQDRDVGLQAADDAVVAARSARAVEGEAEIVAAHHLVAGLR